MNSSKCRCLHGGGKLTDLERFLEMPPRRVRKAPTGHHHPYAHPGGQESQAYRFLSGGQAYVARVNRSAAGFEKDAFAHREFARPGLAIPAVIHIGQVQGSFYCISENVSGATLQDIHADDLPQILGPTASVMQSIANSDLAKMTGYGPFDANGVGKSPGWRDFLTSAADGKLYDWAAFRSKVDLDLVSPLVDRICELAAYCPETRGLIHGDFGSNNVLAEGSRITGIIDWSEAAIGDPLYDAANIFFWRTWLPCMEQQALYFERHPDNSPYWAERLLGYQLRIGLAEIYESAFRGNWEAAAGAQLRCREINRLARGSGL